MTAFVIIACILLSVSALAQTITFSKKNVTINELRKVLEKQAGYTIFNSNSISSQLKPVNINITNGTVQQLLDDYFRYQSCTYTIIDKIITVIPRGRQTLIGSNLTNIKGKIINEQGEPIPGATVTIKGSQQQTSTNENGEFRLNGINEIDLAIVVTSVNYEPEVVSWRQGDEPNLNVRLRQHISELNKVQVVSTGYQKISKDKSPGSFVKIDNELLNRRVSTNVIDRLEGITSGLIFNKNVNTNTNQSNLSIRGRSTIFANPNPLIVVDNFPYNGDINNINPNDVESITVLKDADAASIWGAYSGNGVIIITTKKGKYNQSLKLSFNSNVTVSEKPDLYYQPILNASDYIDVEQFLFNNRFYYLSESDGSRKALSPVVETLIQERDKLISPATAAARLNELRGQDKRKDLEKYFYRAGVNQQYAVNASGGSTNNHYYFSLGYDKNLENLVRNEYDRINLTANNSFSWLKKKLEFNTGIIYTETKMRNNNTITSLASLNNPYLDLVDDNGYALTVNSDVRQTYKDSAGKGILLDWNFKPYDELKFSDNSTKTTDYRINADAKYTLFKWLDATVLYQYNKGFIEQEDYKSQQTYFTRNLINQFTAVDSLGLPIRPVPLGGILDQASIRYNAHNIRTQLNFNQSWYNRNHSKHHQVTALAGTEVRSYRSFVETLRLYGYKQNQPNNNLIDYEREYPLYHAPFIYQKIPFLNDKRNMADRYISYYLNAKYIYQRRYILSASARKDESNLFGVSANQKGIPLWSVGASWELSQENFYRMGWLPFLKLRVTNGYKGNVDKTVSAFTTARYDNPNNYSALPASIANPPNPSLRWEKNHMVNFGVDFATRNSILEGSLEYYFKKGTDLIGYSPLDPTTGVIQFRGNTADMKGQGADIVLRSKNLNTRRFKWVSTLLFSYATDKVTSYKVKQSAIWYYCDPQYISPIEGKPLYSIFSLKWMGLDSTNGDPQGLYDKRISKDYSAIFNSNNLDDLIYRGPANPTYFGSLRNNFTFKQLELSFTISWKMGYYFRRNSINYNNLFSGATPGHSDYEKRWLQPGDEAFTSVPSMQYIASSVTSADRSRFYTYSDVLIEKGDHIRLQDIQVSYQLNKNDVKGLPINQFRIYVYTNNLGILWKANDKGIDPDYISSAFPNPRTIAAGLKIDF
ncbi:SusC/RagA family TonB-linked outer membrane protein [Longitalea luteola]|uniref:SusC/RagA family TonB-linked outer membrane protein n=1 Tax=Longitalea luteola TaxID=2812563 RepID=UPI001A962939|nr:SusC/RagA family TonB-linked outer membrane protein [Longitalea luteola]